MWSFLRALYAALYNNVRLKVSHWHLSQQEYCNVSRAFSRPDSKVWHEVAIFLQGKNVLKVGFIALWDILWSLFCKKNTTNKVKTKC